MSLIEPRVLSVGGSGLRRKRSTRAFSRHPRPTDVPRVESERQRRSVSAYGALYLFLFLLTIGQ